MGWKNLVIIFMIIMSFSNCCIPIIQKKFYRTQEGFERPKKSHFKLAKQPYNLKATDFIKTNCVYQDEVIIKDDNGNIINSLPQFMRFFSNGRYISGGILKKEPPLYYYNNLKRGHVGYYRIIGNKIIMEYFSVEPQDCGEYHTLELEINEKGIGDFKEIKVEGLTGKPNW